MKYEPIPVNPEIITWARVRAGFSLDDLTDKFKAIEAWEAGEASPSYPQLEKMAEKFHTPIAVFFFPEPPDVPPISETFRTIPQDEYELLPGRMRYLLRKAKVYQINLNELTDGKNPSPRIITRDLAPKTSTSIEKLASQVRDYLEISLDTQCSWSNLKTALENWRAVLHDVGIAVFKDQFRAASFSGFCLYDPEFPLIYVNNTTPKTRQIFTLFHELAHLLFHTSGIDGLTDDFIHRLPADGQEIEVICNRFAAEFLLPEAVFETAFAGMDPTEEAAQQLASRFHVSRESIFRRFLDRDLISQSHYQTAAKKWATEAGGGTGGDYYNNVITYLGRDYINLAFTKYYSNRIDNVQLADYLNVSARNVSTLEEKFLRGAG